MFADERAKVHHSLSLLLPDNAPWAETGLLLQHFSGYLFIASAILHTNSSCGVVMGEILFCLKTAISYRNYSNTVIISFYCTANNLWAIIIIKERREILKCYYNVSTSRAFTVLCCLFYISEDASNLSWNTRVWEEQKSKTYCFCHVNDHKILCVAQTNQFWPWHRWNKDWGNWFPCVCFICD